jgi:hypothetical protein
MLFHFNKKIMNEADLAGVILTPANSISEVELKHACSAHGFGNNL